MYHKALKYLKSHFTGARTQLDFRLLDIVYTTLQLRYTQREYKLYSRHVHDNCGGWNIDNLSSLSYLYTTSSVLLLWVSKIQWLRSRSTSGDTWKVCTPERIQIPGEGPNILLWEQRLGDSRKLPGENAVYCSTLSCPRPQLHRPLHLKYE